MTPKENALKMIYNEKPDYIPLTFEAFRAVGMPLSAALEEPFESGYDPFGIYWHVDNLGGVPDNSKFAFDDIADWEKYVKIPDISHIPFKDIASKELESIDREQQLLTYYHPCGLWERVVTFIGFENALISLLEDPDSWHDLLEVLTRYKIEIAKNIIDAYHPDVYVDFSDVATANSLFMSKQTYRDVIKPHQAEFIRYITGRGVIFEQHCCGRCEELMDDFVDMGARLWHSAQPMNDIAAIEQKYLGKLTVEGGWDSSGLPGMIHATNEDVREETRRCLREYGHSGGFILMPVLINEEGNALLLGKDKRLPALIDEWNKNKAL